MSAPASPAIAPDPAAAAYAPERLAMLVGAGGVRLLERMMALFEESLPGRLAAIRGAAAAPADALEPVRQAAHALKGSSMQLGALALAAACLAVERAAKVGPDAAVTPAQVDAVLTEAAATRAWLASEVARLRAD